MTVEAQRIFNAVGDREGEADALRMQDRWIGLFHQVVDIDGENRKLGPRQKCDFT